MTMDKKTVIVTGGAGYIGSCTAHLLKQEGFNPIAFDNFSTSRKPTHSIFPVWEVDLTDRKQVENACSKLPKVHAVFHFAAKALVPESTEKPWDYFFNNLNATLNMADCAAQFSIPYFIHSSTCAVYGIPDNIPIEESSPLRPETPYGQSKLASENILEQYSKWKQLRVLNLRYFNPAGAFPELGLGELHEPETHLVPNLVKSFSQKTAFQAFGNDYPTSDGTCVRDFIHIKDLARAHILALAYLENSSKTKFDSVNIGKGTGVSVGEAIKAAEQVLGIQGQIKFQPRRAGDPAELVADTKKMTELFKWTPELSLNLMIEDHWKFIQGRIK
jgi:UDP-glucose-4-epimerase GalE